MATVTYEAIKSYTFTSTASSFSWTSIPSTYTDLVIVGKALNGTGTNYEAYITYNGDTSSSYSFAFVQNYAGSLQAGQNLNIAQTRQFKTGNTDWSGHIQHILNYSNTNVYKSSIGRSGDPMFRSVILAVGLWRSTAAINRIDITMESGASFLTNTKFDLYGIKAE